MVQAEHGLVQAVHQCVAGSITVGCGPKVLTVAHRLWRGNGVRAGGRRSSAVGQADSSSDDEDEAKAASFGGPSEAELRSIRIFKALNRLTNNLKGVHKIVVQIEELRFEIECTVRPCCALSQPLPSVCMHGSADTPTVLPELRHIFVAARGDGAHGQEAGRREGEEENQAGREYVVVSTRPDRSVLVRLLLSFQR